MDAITVAAYLKGKKISEPKAQKLLFFAQGIKFWMVNWPMFLQEIEAWEEGPIIQEVRKQWNNLQYNAEFSIHTLDFLDSLIEVFEKYNENSLTNLVHELSAWVKTFEIGPNIPIPLEAIMNYTRSDNPEIEKEILGLQKAVVAFYEVKQQKRFIGDSKFLVFDNLH